MKPEDRLRRLLEEDLGSTEEAEALFPLIQQLRDVPLVTTAPRLAALVAEMPSAPQQSYWRQLWLILKAQIRVVRREIWLASLLIMTLGVFVTIAQYQASSAQALALLAPLVSAAGVAFIYGPVVDPPMEILLSMPVSPRVVLLARLTLVYGFNLALGLAASVTLVMIQSGLSLWPLVVAWLVPMTFLSALAFCLGVFTRDPMMSALTCFVLWVFVHSDMAAFFNAPDLLSVSARPFLLMLAAGLGMVALWLGGDEDWWVGELA
ncbi:MAG: hypothetical protein H6673_04470 [Anaerolineales bacterium]|nr:hypothetical protein [Anaerolineales bacterium]